MRLRETQKVFILDIRDYGAKLMFSIKNLFQFKSNHWSSQYEYEEKVRSLYLELFQQIAVTLNKTRNENDYFLELINVPNYLEPAFNTIYQIQHNNGSELDRLSKLTREVAVFLFNEIRTKITNEIFKYEYVVEQAAYTYIVISVFDVSENT